MAEQTQAPRRKQRSPNYPGIDLGAALKRAQIVWGREQHHPAAQHVILNHWGYAPKSGGGAVAYAALKRFGLLEDHGRGEARLTQLALDILRSQHEGRPDYEKIREAALRPAMHRDLWQEYRASLPSNESLQFKLVTEKGFTPGGADEFISEWKRTLSFAKLAEATGSVGPDATPSTAVQSEESVPASSPPVPPPPTDAPATAPTSTPRSAGAPAASGSSAYRIPLSNAGRVAAFVHLPDSMSEGEWARFLTVLEAMKPGLVSSDES